MELAELIKKVDTLKAELDNLKPIKPEYQKKLDEKISLEFNYNSNHLEGNTLTIGETMALLIFDEHKGGHNSRDYDEMLGHNAAFKLIKTWAEDKEQPLTESMIKNLNKLILKEPFKKEAKTLDGQKTTRLIKVGDYKEFPNNVELPNGGIFEFASPTDTPIKMGELMQWYRSEEESGELHPSVLAALFHYRFVRIHPFDDGNGRCSRLLMNYILLRNNLPPVIVKSTDKKNYLSALHDADTGDLDSFVGYIENQLIWSLNLIIKGAETGIFEEEDDLDKKISLLKSELAATGEEDVTITFSKSSFMQIYDSWLSELMKGFIVEVKKFNELFVSQPAHYISINTGMHQGHSSMGVIIENFLDGIEGETITKLRERLVAPMQMIHPDTEVTLNSSFGLFKKGAIKHRFGASFSIEVFFTNVKYDVFITDNFGDVDRCPDITEQLKIILAKNESIDKIYFDKNGLGYLEERLNKKNGKYYINDEEIRSIYTREDILNDKIRSNGMVRYREERLLHKPLKPEEIKELCKTLSTNIYEHIDFYTRKYGIR